MNPISVATKGKGINKMLERIAKIFRQYGYNSKKMQKRLDEFVATLREFNSGATFPITGAALARNPGVIEKYQSTNIEFALHGFYHIDHSGDSLDHFETQLSDAQEIFKSRGINCSGFRFPYLRFSQEALSSVKKAHFSYDGSQAVYWDVVSDHATPAYQRALEFYNAKSSQDYLCIPWLENGFVHIPYCLPDDESLIERLNFDHPEQLNQTWLKILEQTYITEELFTLGLHPERIFDCVDPLKATLRKARELSPGVWIARLDEISKWWAERIQTKITITEGSQNNYTLNINGPEGITILAKNIETSSNFNKWHGNTLISNSQSIKIYSTKRPFIGIPTSASTDLTSFLIQLGFLYENSDAKDDYGIFISNEFFQEYPRRRLLNLIHNSNAPLVRLGRWPYGNKSALNITGDIDALTLKDYFFRFLGK